MVYVLLLLVILVFYHYKKKELSFYALKLKRNFLSLCILLMIIGIIFFANSSMQISKASISLWANNVLPSLFCFLICLELLKQTSILEVLSQKLTPLMQPLFGVPGCGGLALVLGILSGYPIGAIVTTNLYEKGVCTKQEAEKILAFTNTSGPIFMIGAVGVGMFCDEKMGYLLFFSHLLASITVGIILKKYHLSSRTSDIISQVSIKSNPSPKIRLQNLGENMKNAIQNSISTLTMILGFMVFFGVLGSLLSKIGFQKLFCQAITPVLAFFHLSENLASSIFQGLLEMTSGIHKLANEIRIPMVQKICLTSFLLGFGGISVHMQVMSVVSKAKLSLKPYFIGKLLHGITACIYTYVLYYLLNNSVI